MKQETKWMKKYKDPDKKRRYSAFYRIHMRDKNIVSKSFWSWMWRTFYNGR